MSYTVQVRVFQSDPKTFFYQVEQGVWKYANGGTWGYNQGGLRLTMGGSGTAGILRFIADTGSEAFVVVCGVHNYKPWVDIVTNLNKDMTGVSILPEYYNDQDPARVKAREAQRDKYSVKNSAGRTIEANMDTIKEHGYILRLVIGPK
ncbi:Sea anemone cytolysin [Beauveria brongniartii RCEF 3172]|uniref:Sea anemone cytolysin n=1 Tax=Beauveria brongniartii RCEF 3172 TaxID=1081107 RepID=A0A167I9X8_9HYPO|nr:Sea anemone cytolysin [Beauveria brongniartii RCEF 3172]